MPEGFRPAVIRPPTGRLGRLVFHARRAVNLQMNTVYRDLQRGLSGAVGTVLDVGCGQSPYRHLLDPAVTRYIGLEIADAGKFDVQNTDVLAFDGKNIPLEDQSCDLVLCTEVLEHVQDYQRLVDEVHRVLKPGGRALVTVPWSARFHYAPFDYFRYTPSQLTQMFSHFTDVRVTPRGSDVSAIASKLVVLFARHLKPGSLGQALAWPLWLMALPVLGSSLVAAHVSLALGLGSTEDPLGYTLLAQKPEATP